jgi:hypothetical protein
VYGVICRNVINLRELDLLPGSVDLAFVKDFTHILVCWIEIMKENQTLVNLITISFTEAFDLQLLGKSQPPFHLC